MVEEVRRTALKAEVAKGLELVRRTTAQHERVLEEEAAEGMARKRGPRCAYVCVLAVGKLARVPHQMPIFVCAAMLRQNSRVKMMQDDDTRLRSLSERLEAQTKTEVTDGKGLGSMGMNGMGICVRLCGVGFTYSLDAGYGKEILVGMSKAALFLLDVRDMDGLDKMLGALLAVVR